MALRYVSPFSLHAIRTSNFFTACNQRWNVVKKFVTSGVQISSLDAIDVGME
uniref:Uncharacterized protein n=1 Tax=Arundo donax TaxID=35708 RepID=A0A0A9B3K6_ARUDO